MPALPPFENGWRIGKPDAIFDIGTTYDVPAEGVVAYKYFTVPTNFKSGVWIRAAEIELTSQDLEEIARAIEETKAGSGPTRPRSMRATAD